MSASDSVTAEDGRPENITILGSTGSIGENTLDVVARNRGRFRIAALTANRNVERLAQQCAQFRASVAVIAKPELEQELRRALESAGSKAEAMSGVPGLLTAAGLPEADTVMAAIVGAAGLEPTLRAAETGKKILLANKESLVIAGEVFIDLARRNQARILPVDSEHNAIFQALPPGFEQGLDEAGVDRIVLTASGGPFLNLPAEQLAAVTPEQACRHPNWDMGRKISVDSATLMNKGLEVIEARWLFNARPDQLEVLIHPQSIVHSMVAYRDGSVLAQMGRPDMRTPIAHTLAWPGRIEAGVQRLNLAETADLSFMKPDLHRFPCLGLAFDAMRAGRNAPVALNAANEIAVECFLQARIGFDKIPVVISEVMQGIAPGDIGCLEDVLEQDELARRKAREIAEHMS